jgi:hypothetical protein
MKRSLLLLLLVAALGAPANAAGGMSSLEYYVGSWTCVAGNVGEKPVNATVEYTMNAGVLREWVLVPVQGKMKSPYGLSIVQSWDAKHGRYVSASNDNMGGWSVSYAKPWSGNTEEWVDHASAITPGHSTTVRDSANAFHFMSYPTTTSMKANFKGSCKKAM